MRFTLNRLVQAALLASCLGLIFPVMALADAALSSFRIDDKGEFFSKEALEKAEGKIEAIKTNYNKDVLIETFAKLPEAAANKYARAKTDKEKGKFWIDFSGERYDKRGVSGIYVLISREPRRIVLGVGEKTKQKAFTEENRKKAEQELINSFRDSKFDQGLLTLVNDIDLTLNANMGKVKSSTAATTPRETPRESTGGGGMFDNIWGIICIGLVVILALWLVFGLIRGLMGGGRPLDRAPGGYAGGPGPGYAQGPGYAPGPGYAQPQSSGGGFFTNMLGGMFGAAAGMYIYDSFFRGSSPTTSSWGTPSAHAGGPTPTPPDTSDRKMSENTGGGDWSSPSTSAPADGGGGGDWGGGTDGGGGDWAGGADAGSGGGGGDWGGGGDAGGSGDAGGGDWGGGGGGDSGGGDW